jgi:glutamate synthase domain-containing protein 1
MAIGMLFLPGRHSRTPEAVTSAMITAVEDVSAQAGLEVLMWRKVPVGEYALGESAKLTLPDIRQVN